MDEIQLDFSDDDQFGKKYAAVGGLVPESESSDEFGSSSEEEHQPQIVQSLQLPQIEERFKQPEQVKFKELMTLTLEQQKKRNQLLDFVIAEVEESDRSDSEQPKITTKAAYMNKFSKLTQLTNETTKEYKAREKQDQQKQLTSQILRKAKEDARKIEQYKQKFRMSANGGVFTNQLKQVVENRKQASAQKESALQSVEPIQIVQETTVVIKADLDDILPIIKPSKKKKCKKQTVASEAPAKPRGLEVIQLGHVDWEKLVENPSQDIQNEEEEQKDLELRKQVFDFDRSFQYFKTVDLSKEIESIQDTKEASLSFMQKLLSCSRSTARLDQDKSPDRDMLFALARVKLNTQIPEHEIIVKSLYRSLLKKDSCRSIGSHWQDIGFQATDPTTDIRGAGMLGVLQMQYFLSKMPLTLQTIHKHSTEQKSEFPLAVKMFEFSVLILALMRSQTLYRSCNQLGVFSACNLIYCAAFLRFSEVYIETGASIKNVFQISQQVEAECKSGTIKAQTFTDEEGVQKLVRASDRRRQASIQQLVQSEPKFKVVSNSEAKGHTDIPRSKKFQKYQSDDSEPVQKAEVKKATSDGFSTF